MKKHICGILILLSSLIIGCSHNRNLVAQWSKSQRPSIAESIEKIINDSDPNINIGVKIVSLETNQSVFEKNSQRLFMPASTIKLITLAAALHYLGPSHRFTTSIFTDAFEHKKGQIKNLYLKGSGDPSLMDSDLTHMARELKQMGIKSVSGDLYVDDTIFDDLVWSRGIMWDDRNFGYSAPVSGLNLNYNRLQIKTVPAHDLSHLAHVIVTPMSKLYEVKSEALTKNKNESRALSFVVEHSDHRKEEWPTQNIEGLKTGDKIIVQGHIPIQAAPHYSTLAVNNPSILAGTFLKEQLEHLGIKVEGKVVRAAAPSEAFMLTSFQSRSLSEALVDFTKISNNIANDSLIKAIAASQGIQPATSSAGLKLVKDFLAQEVGIPSSSLVTADGAGVSRYSLISPEQMVRLLLYSAQRFNVSAEFLAALPIAGNDGALTWRMNNTYQKGQVRAKTGTMTGISCIAGYFANDVGRFAFSIMINGFVGSSQKYTKMQDDILATMFKPSDMQQVAKVK